MKRIIQASIFCATLLAFPVVEANDSIGALGAGGLELQKTDDIEMVSEVLEIWEDKIRVTYHYLNTSDKDIKTTVAFPMPAYSDIRFAGENVYEEPLKTFKSIVNGTQVPVQVSRVFRINDVDVTDRLRKLGLTDSQIFDHDFNCFDRENPTAPIPSKCKITHEQDEAIRNMGAISLGHSEIQETAYWEQNFPAKKEIEVIHEYTPFTGWRPGSVDSYTRKGANNVDVEVCLDESTRRAIGRNIEEFKKQTDGIPPNAFFKVASVAYILGTGRNWKGPIKDFTLVIHKGSPETIVSLCFPGKPVKTKPDKIEFRHKNFVPQDELLIYFYLI